MPTPADRRSPLPSTSLDGRRVAVPGTPSLRILGAVSAVLLTATACTGTDSIPASEAEAHYDAMMDDVRDVLAERDLPLTHSEASREFAVRDGECLYTPGNYRSEELAQALNEDGGWEPVIAAVNPVLEEHGFETRDAPTQSGGLQLVEVGDGYGAEFSITGYGDVRVWGARTDDAACGDT